MTNTDGEEFVDLVILTFDISTVQVFYKCHLVAIICHPFVSYGTFLVYDVMTLNFDLLTLKRVRKIYITWATHPKYPVQR